MFNELTLFNKMYLIIHFVYLNLFFVIIWYAIMIVVELKEINKKLKSNDSNRL